MFVLMAVFILKPLLGSKQFLSKCNLIIVSIHCVCIPVIIVNKTADNTKHMVGLHSNLIQFSY